jgi:hypothetical protein
MLLREEMRRVLRFLIWRAEWWDARADLRLEVDAAMRGGLRGYAAKQARLCRRLRDHFYKEWDKPVVTGSEAFGTADGVADLEEGELEELFAQ